MLILTKFIGHGATRICFEHPQDVNKCVKIATSPKNTKLLLKEIETYFSIQSYLSEYILKYENKLIDTNQGPGLVCELLRDHDGSYSKPLDYWLFQNKMDAEIISQLWHFSYCLIEHDIFFYDFNLKNFIIQKRNNHKFLYYTDLKSFENYKSWTFLKLEKIITPLARYLMIKRLRRLFKTLKISINRDKKATR